MMDSDKKRFFFAAQIQAPWPQDYPPARMIPEETRHVTLAFLGEQSLSKLQELLPSVPLPPFRIAPAGIGKELLFLPPGSSRVAALSIEWLDSPSSLETYQHALSLWLQNHGYPMDQRSFLSHVTISRAPFEKKAWEEHFTPLPLFVSAIHLYESVGHLEYRSLWNILLQLPFEEFEHTADIAFHIYGNSLQQLHQNAQLALAFKFPLLVEFFSSTLQEKLEEIIISLNEIVGLADAKYGCPFKAISFHGLVKEAEDNLLHWEMIVDV